MKDLVTQKGAQGGVKQMLKHQSRSPYFDNKHPVKNFKNDIVLIQTKTDPQLQRTIESPGAIESFAKYFFDGQDKDKKGYIDYSQFANSLDEMCNFHDYPALDATKKELLAKKADPGSTGNIVFDNYKYEAINMLRSIASAESYEKFQELQSFHVKRR